MKLRWVLIGGLALACGCKGKGKDAASAVGGAASGVGSGSAVVVADAAVAIDASPDTNGVMQTEDGGDDELRRIAFDNKVPVLPAVSHDGTWIADWRSDGGGPMPVPPLSVVFTALGSGKDETLELATFEDVGELHDELTEKSAPPALVKLVKERAAVIVKRLEDFESLAEFDHDRSKLRLAIVEGDADQTVTLTNEAGKRVRRMKIEAYAEGSGDDRCNFRPMRPTIYENQSKTRLYGEVRFRFRDDCGMPPASYFVWDLAGEDPDPGADLAKDAVAIAGSAVGPATAKPEGDAQLDVGTSADGKSAWASVVAKDKRRVSYVLAAVPGGTWNIVALTATTAVPNAAANADAKAGKLKAPAAFTVDAGDATLRAALATLTSEGMKAPPPSLVAFGSGPGERTTTGDALAKGWNAGWKGKATVTSSIARVLPSGTTGWVAANVELAKAGYKIPFHLFAVFDKASSGEWTLVHLHFSVPAP